MKEKLRKLKKNKTAIGVIGIVSAILLTILNISLKDTYSGGSYTKAFIATSEIASGDKITDGMIKEIKLQGDIPKSVISSKEEIIDKYANINIYSDDIITKEKLNVEAIYGSAYLENLSENERAISVSLKTLAVGLSGKLESGDIVSVISIDEDGNSKILDELRYVEIVSVSDDSGYEVDTSESSSDKNVGATTTLLVNEQQATLLAGLEVNGLIHIALVYRGNDDYKQKLLNEQKNVFKN